MAAIAAQAAAEARARFGNHNNFVYVFDDNDDDDAVDEIEVLDHNDFLQLLQVIAAQRLEAEAQLDEEEAQRVALAPEAAQRLIDEQEMRRYREKIHMAILAQYEGYHSVQTIVERVMRPKVSEDQHDIMFVGQYDIKPISYDENPKLTIDAQIRFAQDSDDETAYVTIIKEMGLRHRDHLDGRGQQKPLRNRRGERVRGPPANYLLENAKYSGPMNTGPVPPRQVRPVHFGNKVHPRDAYEVHPRAPQRPQPVQNAEQPNPAFEIFLRQYRRRFPDLQDEELRREARAVFDHVGVLV